MADKNSAEPPFSGILSHYWLHILAIIFLFFVWKFGVVKEVLSVIGTLLLCYISFKFWLHYIQQDFISGITWVLLEVIPPREVLRSPEAMELFLTNALYHMSNKGGKEEYWQGAVWFWFSLEIVSIDGQVHFYIRTPSRIQGLIETQMYAQYPQAQVRVVEDYTLAVDEISPKSAWNAWGAEFKLDKHEAFPIKTYVDYKLNDDPKEEYKIDPISPLIEFFGSLQKGEQAWMQLVITPSKKEFHTEGTWFGHHDWVKESRIQIQKMLLPFTAERSKVSNPSDISKEIRSPKFMDDVVEAMSKKISKVGFEAGIRVMYVAKKEIFPPGKRTNNSRNIRLIFRQYAKPDCNQLERCNPTQGDAYGGIFSIGPELVMKISDRMLTEYRERSFFHNAMRHTLLADKFPIPWPISPFLILGYKHQHTYVLNTEEIATLWHFPGQILKVPTLERIESKEASPPPNLPI